MAQDDTPTSEQPAAGDAPDSELARLRAENERLQQELDATGPDGAGSRNAAAGPRHRGRWFASWVLIVVGSLLVPVSVTSLWLNRTITDTDRYVETVAPLIRDQDIQRAIESRLEKVLYAQVDIQAEVANVLPERAAPLAAPITAGLKNLISEVIHRVVTSPKVAELWDRANRIAQEQVKQVLTVSNGRKGVVSVDLTDTLKEVQKQLTDAGVPFVGNITVPKVDLDVMQSDTIAQVQTAFGIFDRLATILPWLTLLVLGAGILAAPDRRKGLVHAASGWVIGSLLLLVSVALGRMLYLNALPPGVSMPANETFFDTISRFLRGGGRTVLVLGLLILVVTLVTGPSGPAVRFRTAVSRLVGAAGSGVDRTGVDLGPVPAFVGRNLMALRAVVGIGALLVFLVMDQPSAGAVLWIAIGALVVLAVIEILGRSARTAAAATEGADSDASAGASGATPLESGEVPEHV